MQHEEVPDILDYHIIVLSYSSMIVLLYSYDYILVLLSGIQVQVSMLFVTSS